ncbi:hypothetical protein B0H17DRAFT_1110377, partial [Mycena rosella]
MLISPITLVWRDTVLDVAPVWCDVSPSLRSVPPYKTEVRLRNYVPLISSLDRPSATRSPLAEPSPTNRTAHPCLTASSPRPNTSPCARSGLPRLRRAEYPGH